MSGLNKRRLKIVAFLLLIFGIAAPLLYLLNLVFAVFDAARLRSTWRSDDLYDALLVDWRKVRANWKDPA